MYTPEQSAAFLMSQSVACLAEISGMNAENQYRKICGDQIAYAGDSFEEVLCRYYLREDLANYILVHGEIPNVQKGQ